MRFDYSDGAKYEVDEQGVVHQINAKPFRYDAAYSAIYDTPEYKKKSELLQGLRMGFIIGAFGKIPDSLQDNGYGNGAFMEFAKYAGIESVFGYDVTGVEVEGCTIVDKMVAADVYTFHDCLEHIPNLSFIRDVACEMVVISLPWYPGDKHFEKWKHRKPNEHLHHFTYDSLTAFMKSMGWNIVAFGTHEDVVRQPEYGASRNILTAAFKRT